MTTDRAAFEAQIDADPYEPAPRLVYADWLEERGEDDAASEQRRRARPEWARADKWLRRFAARCGETCVNYSQVWDQYRQEAGDAVFRQNLTDADQSLISAAGERARAVERWEPITLEQVIQAGYNLLRTGWPEFVQQGSERARTLLENPKRMALFWVHWEAWTGIHPDFCEADGGMGRNPFSCSC